eukprot:2470076-Amphidinium_carterae.1
MSTLLCSVKSDANASCARQLTGTLQLKDDCSNYADMPRCAVNDSQHQEALSMDQHQIGLT